MLRVGGRQAWQMDQRFSLPVASQRNSPSSMEAWRPGFTEWERIGRPSERKAVTDVTPALNHFLQYKKVLFFIYPALDGLFWQLKLRKKIENINKESCWQLIVVLFVPLLTLKTCACNYSVVCMIMKRSSIFVLGYNGHITIKRGRQWVCDLVCDLNW